MIPAKLIQLWIICNQLQLAEAKRQGNYVNEVLYDVQWYQGYHAFFPLLSPDFILVLSNNLSVFTSLHKIVTIAHQMPHNANARLTKFRGRMLHTLVPDSVALDKLSSEIAQFCVKPISVFLLLMTFSKMLE